MAGDLTIESDLLLHAVMQRKVKLVRILLDGGVDVNVRDDMGRTALMSACIRHGSYKLESWNREERILTLLLEKGADPVAKDKHGRTALTYAIQYTAPWSMRNNLELYGANIAECFYTTFK
ncbi:ankyrin repeat domain-containing protein 34A-like [Ylistrum balloti]|uniref:ankyrin repeat domain-containing protein 34A-like n=1 Tax=Ylistrum balloti TaxID=509963 RepID=UPI002905F45E|nr:ankyrin repeat domain-containing protein 34A-like [Ylistrum balloti]